MREDLEHIQFSCSSNRLGAAVDVELAVNVTGMMSYRIYTDDQVYQRFLYTYKPAAIKV